MPNLASANLAKIGFIQETTFRTVPTAGNGVALRYTGESLANAIPTVTSKEIRSDRLTADLIQVGSSVSGGFNFELSFKEYDPLFEAVFGGTWTTNRLTNGTVKRTFIFEKNFTDINQFFAYVGCGISKVSLNIEAGAIVTGSFDVMGSTGIRGTVTVLPGTIVPSQTFDVMNGVFGVGTVLENGVPLTGTFLKSIKFDIDGKLRALEALGQLGAVDINQGTMSITGEMDMYLADGAIYDKFVNQTASSIGVPIRDAAGNGYTITFPRIKYKDAKVVAGGLDQDAMITVPFEGLFDPVTGFAIMMDRHAA